MKKKLASLSVVVLLVTVFLMLRPSSYPPITGTVVDAVTGQPIEGAVVLVEWTKTHGIGEHWTESFKVEEAVTNKEGKFTVAGLDARSVNPPNLTIYKKGYVAWNNEYIFPGYKKREDFSWRSGYVFRLEHFKPEYLHSDHISFIHRSIRLGLGRKKIIGEAVYWEELEAERERDK